MDQRFFFRGSEKKLFLAFSLFPEKKTSDTLDKWTSAFKGFMYEDTAI